MDLADIEQVSRERIHLQHPQQGLHLHTYNNQDYAAIKAIEALQREPRCHYAAFVCPYFAPNFN